MTQPCRCQEHYPDVPTIRYYEGVAESIFNFTDASAGRADWVTIDPLRRRIAALRLRAFADSLDPQDKT